jgi:hypothetical protein
VSPITLQVKWLFTYYLDLYNYNLAYNDYKAIFSYNKLLNIVENDNVLNTRFVYLITYSQADLSLVPERESFALLVIHAFQNADPLLAYNILQWVCSKEHHIPVNSYNITV